jgi:hypothetical protein
MGTYAHILKNWEKHNPEKLFVDTALICFRINVMLHFNNSSTYFEDGRFKHTYLSIVDDAGFVKVDNDRQFIFNIQGVNIENISVDVDTDFDYLVPNAKLCSLAYIEKVRGDNIELIFRFVYEYLKINPDEYFWFEGDWVYSWEDMQKLKSLPFDPDWCFKNPNYIE